MAQAGRFRWESAPNIRSLMPCHSVLCRSVLLELRQQRQLRISADGAPGKLREPRQLVSDICFNQQSHRHFLRFLRFAHRYLYCGRM